MRHGSLFSGIGGFDLAAEWMGWENVFQVEKDSFCQKVLEKNFPNTKRYGDIKEFDGRPYRGTVDVLSGGFPCQTFSLAGEGTLDLSLWKEMLRVVGEIRPKVIVAENVYGLLVQKKGVALSTVLDDLESESYQTMPPFIIPALAIGANHRRDRIWIVAYSNSDLPQRGSKQYGISEADGESETSILSGEGANQDCISEPFLFGGNDGIPDRVDRTQAIGNSIHPKVAYEIFKAINQINHERRNDRPRLG